MYYYLNLTSFNEDSAGKRTAAIRQRTVATRHKFTFRRRQAAFKLMTIITMNQRVDAFTKQVRLHRHSTMCIHNHSNSQYCEHVNTTQLGPPFTVRYATTSTYIGNSIFFTRELSYQVHVADVVSHYCHLLSLFIVYFILTLLLTQSSKPKGSKIN